MFLKEPADYTTLWINALVQIFNSRKTILKKEKKSAKWLIWSGSSVTLQNGWFFPSNGEKLVFSILFRECNIW